MASIAAKLSRSAVLLVGVAVLMVLVYGGAYLVGAGLKPPRLEMPPYDLTKFPWDLQLPSGSWHGRPAKIDEGLTRSLKAQARVVEDREYRGPGGRVISMHMAIFNDHQLGLTHTPFECYRGNGWNKLDGEYAEIRGAGDQQARVSISLWRRENQRIYVLYWYQFGNEVLLDRDDLGRFRWKMAGKESWPALVKVMITCGAEALQNRESIVELAEYTYRWMTAGGQAVEAPADEQALPGGENSPAPPGADATASHPADAAADHRTERHG